MITLALFIGIVGTIFALRAFGTVWPWELAAAAPAAARVSARVNGSSFHRVPLNVAGRVVAGMRKDGATLIWWHSSDGLVSLLFERKAE